MQVIKTPEEIQFIEINGRLFPKPVNEHVFVIKDFENEKTEDLNFIINNIKYELLNCSYTTLEDDLMEVRCEYWKIEYLED